MEYKKNEIIIFDIFLDSDHKINIFKQTLNSVKKLNLPIMVISNFDVPNYFILKRIYCLPIAMMNTINHMFLLITTQKKLISDMKKCLI